jgi:hypothetical protein
LLVAVVAVVKTFQAELVAVAVQAVFVPRLRQAVEHLELLNQR